MMDALIRQALKKALSEAVKETLTDIDSGAFDVVHINCECGKSTHTTSDVYCGNCGSKLEKAAGDGSL